MAAPDPFKPTPSATGMMQTPQEFGFEADFADLAARFAAKSGGGLSPELSAELALEIVLNEIVEQGCHVTGATGAAIILERGGELVCRASSGSTTPELGARIDSTTGFAHECVRTRKTVWCDDTSTDPRAASGSSRQMGVRSIAMMPILQGDVFVGIFGLFSTQPYAFGIRDERTLETLVERTLINLEHVSQPAEGQADAVTPAAEAQEEDLQTIGLQDPDLKKVALQTLGLPRAAATQADIAAPARADSGSPEFPPAIPDKQSNEVSASGIAETSLSEAETDSAFPDFDPAEITPEEIQALLSNAGVIPSATLPASQARPPEQVPRLLPPEPVAPNPVDYFNWALGFAIVSAAVLLGLVLGQHFIMSRSHLPAPAAASAPPATRTQPALDPATPPVTKAPKPAGEKNEITAKRSRPDRTSISHEPAVASEETVPPGGLLVFENGKEVFRLPPTHAQDSASAQEITQPASELDSDSSSGRVVELPEGAALREILHRVEPEYPEAARQQNIEGAVVLELHIGTNGSVEDVQIVSGPPLLAQASTDAVKQWKFKPRVVNGSPVQMQTRVTFNFRLPDNPQRPTGKASASGRTAGQDL